MKFIPTHDRILIKPTPPEEERAGLYLLQQDQEQRSEGLVIAVGTGVPLHNVNLTINGDALEANMNSLKEVITLLKEGRPMRVNVGDYVLYGKYAGTKVILDDTEHLIIREADVFGILVNDQPQPVDNTQDY